MKLNIYTVLLFSSLALISCEHYDKIDGHARIMRLHRPSAVVAAPAPTPAPKPAVKKPETSSVVAQNQPVSSSPVPEKPAPIAKPLPETAEPELKKVVPEVKPAASRPEIKAPEPEARAATTPRRKWSFRNLFSRKQPQAAPISPLPESTNADGPIPSELLVTAPAPAANKPESALPVSEVRKPVANAVVSQKQPELKPVPSGASRLPIAPPRAGSQPRKSSYPVMPGQNRGLKARPN